MKVDKKCLNLIEEISNAKGPSGFEDEVIEVAKKYCADFADVKEDKIRNLYIYRKKNTGKKPVVMIDAHSDEVGFMVHSIRPNGTIRVLNLGNWTNSSLPSSKVLIRNSLGEWISGIFVNIPPHFSKGGPRPFMEDIPISMLSIDIGAKNYEEAKNIFHIRMGEPVVPATKFEYDEKNDLIFGKAFDCRIGCAALLEIMRQIKDLDLNVDVIGTLSSQEEVGERGVQVSVNKVKPDVAICLEGCPADDTFLDPYSIQTALKEGPMFRHMDRSMIASPRLQRYILDLANEKDLPIQESVREGGGNNAAITLTSCGGISSVTAGIPVRYIHSMNCICSYYDFDAAVKLVVEILKSLNKEIIDKF